MSERAHPFPSPAGAAGYVVRIAAVLLLAISSVSAQALRGNAQQGRAVAAAQCGECHAVAREGPGTGGTVPSFPAIADLPSTTALSLRVTLRTTHARTRMPSLILTETETDDVIAYILGLARK